MEDKLYGHIAKNNIQNNCISKGLKTTVIIKSANSYISPKWYVSDNMVPTWNYQSVKIDSELKKCSDYELIYIMDEISQYYENKLDYVWNPSIIDESKYKEILSHVTGFEMSLDNMIGNFKLSQNRSKDDIISVIKN